MEFQTASHKTNLSEKELQENQLSHFKARTEELELNNSVLIKSLNEIQLKKAPFYTQIWESIIASNAINDLKQGGVLLLLRLAHKQKEENGYVEAHYETLKSWIGIKSHISFWKILNNCVNTGWLRHKVTPGHKIADFFRVQIPSPESNSINFKEKEDPFEDKTRQ